MALHPDSALLVALCVLRGDLRAEDGSQVKVVAWTEFLHALRGNCKCEHTNVWHSNSWSTLPDKWSAATYCTCCRCRSRGLRRAGRGAAHRQRLCPTSGWL